MLQLLAAAVVIGIVLPDAVRVAAGIPGGIALAVFGVWPMDGGRRGLWVGELGQENGRLWPVTGVLPSEAEAWIAAAK